MSETGVPPEGLLPPPAQTSPEPPEGPPQTGLLRGVDTKLITDPNPPGEPPVLPPAYNQPEP